MEINLLKSKSTRLSKADKIRRVNRWLLLSFAGAFGLLVVVLVASFAYYSVNSRVLQARQKTLEASYSSRATEAVTYKRMKELLTVVGQVHAKRVPFQVMLSNVYATLPPGTYVTNADFVDNRVLRFGGRAGGIAEYAAFIKQFNKVSQDANFFYKYVIQDKLIRLISGVYRFDLSLQVKYAK